MKVRKMLWLDVETTGLDETVHEIIEIGAVLTDLQGNALRQVCIKVRPENIALANPEALRVNGYSPEAWVGAHSKREAAQLLRGAAADAILAGWNVGFDARFAKAMVCGQGLEPTWDYHSIDVFALAWPLLLRNEAGLKMELACDLLGVPKEPRPHRAINGARTALALYHELMMRNEADGRAA
jgi:DNA polymerase III epsilon subunit-like protein